jgi:hypothetical protein
MFFSPVFSDDFRFYMIGHSPGGWNHHCGLPSTDNHFISRSHSFLIIPGAGKVR